MKFAAVLSFVSLAAASVVGFDKRTCSGNNCNRAVTGTREGLLPLASRSADCRSFLLTTVTPKPTTKTVTVDYAEGTSIYKREPHLEGRQVTVKPTSIPTYAAVCSSSAAYASACSCLGLTRSVTTAPRPTVTVTKTEQYCWAGY